jgi:hypothetical protein
VGRVEATFHAIDANKSGSLSVREISEFIKQSGMGDSDAANQAKIWFDTLNTNEDAKVITV